MNFGGIMNFTVICKDVLGCVVHMVNGYTILYFNYGEVKDLQVVNLLEGVKI